MLVGDDYIRQASSSRIASPTDCCAECHVQESLFSAGGGEHVKLFDKHHGRNREAISSSCLEDQGTREGEDRRVVVLHLWFTHHLRCAMLCRYLAASANRKLDLNAERHGRLLALVKALPSQLPESGGLRRGRRNRRSGRGGR